MSWSILVVDDEPMTRDLLRLMLEPAGFRVTEAVDGAAALEKVHKHVPDAIILDVMMPKMDGITVCRHLRAQAETADVPVIMLSAKTQAKSVEEAMAVGATKYLTKPISRQTLLDHLHDLLGETAQA